MFQKLDVLYENIDTNELVGRHYSSIGKTVNTYFVKNLNYAYSLLDSKFIINKKPSKIIIQEFLAPGVKPHTDQWPTALNIYLDANGSDITYFYTEPSSFFYSDSLSKNNSILVSKVKTFDESEVKEIGNFVAKSGECYLMNTFLPHSVTINSMTSRYILRFIWDNDNFEVVRDSLKLKQI